MHAGSTIFAPRPVSPVQTALPHHADSPLNPLGCRRASVRPLKTTATATRSNKTHLANLELFLQKQSPPPPLPTPNPGKDPDALNAGGGGGLLHGLNLPSLFPSSRNQPEEIMSPRTLTSLQRLLSDSSHLSPRCSIATRWRHYHGAADWAGLLDPLDENLRRELVRYGDLVQAAYHAFHSQPGTKPDAPRTVALPDRSYRVTRSLFATASAELPPLVDRLVAPWMTARSSWIGYVAVCDHDHEIHRMGRRDIVIALRGTATFLEWAENFRAGLVSIEDGNDNDEKNENSASKSPKVECGFWSLYKTAHGRVPSLSAAVVEEVSRLVNQYKDEELSITVTGHSLGAALAVLVADELSARIPGAPPIAVFSFGGPRVGNRAFADRVEGRGVKVLRVVNAHDVVTRVPLRVGPAPAPPERQTGLEWWPAKVFEGIDGYADVGRELKVDSQASPYLRPNADLACCHDLEAYLHLVDGFMGTNCPFRPNAKRSLARLLCQQGGNVKKLYKRTARELRAVSFVPTATTGEGGSGRRPGLPRQPVVVTRVKEPRHGWDRIKGVWPTVVRIVQSIKHGEGGIRNKNIFFIYPLYVIKILLINQHHWSLLIIFFDYWNPFYCGSYLHLDEWHGILGCT